MIARVSQVVSRILFSIMHDEWMLRVCQVVAIMFLVFARMLLGSS